MRYRLLLIVGGIIFLHMQAYAQAPRFKDVTGHDVGERITAHHEMVRYVEALAERSPRVRLVWQGESWEKRPLPLVVVSDPENLARLDAIQRGAQALADPRVLTPDAADTLIARQPVIVWMGGSIHGNELSGSEALLKLLERLTRSDDPETHRILKEAVVLIDPMLNPDGRDAFVQYNHRRLARMPNPDRRDWNNDNTFWESVGFRTGHYFFDTNRDWFAHTQKETRFRVPTLVNWHPQVSLDLHEMSPNAEFYFDPPALPYGETFPRFAKRWFAIFGKAYAAAFDSAGFEYLTRERYNYLCPGYTTSFSSYQGAVGMLFEQGSSRGLAIERPDGSVRTLAEALEHQYTAAWTALRTAVRYRKQLLREYYEAIRQALQEGREGITHYFLPQEGADDGLVRELVALLQRNGIEVSRLEESVRVRGVRDRTGQFVGEMTFPAGTYVVAAAQPRNRLVRALLEPHIRISEAFLEKARARVERGENPRFYDITAWSLPLMFNLPAYSGRVRAMLPVGSATFPASSFPRKRPAYAYIIDGSEVASMAVLHQLVRQGYRARVLWAPTRVRGRYIPSGSVVVRVGQDAESLEATLRRLADTYHVDVWGVDTGVSEEGYPALGSADYTIPARDVRVALVAEDPVHGYSFGWNWYMLEEQYHIPTTVIRMASLAQTPLKDIDVLVFPEVYDTTRVRQLLGESGVRRLKQWVRDGGVLITLGSVVDVARKQWGLLHLRSWYEVEKERGKVRRFTVPGAMFAGVVDTTVWLTAGVPSQRVLPVLVTSSRVFLPPEGPVTPARRVAVQLTSGQVLLSGFAWPESRERLAGAVFAYVERVGRGKVIAFAEDPGFRGYWRGTDRLMLNAVLLGATSP